MFVCLFWDVVSLCNPRCLELTALLPQPSKCRNYRCVPLWVYVLEQEFLHCTLTSVRTLDEVSKGVCTVPQMRCLKLSVEQHFRNSQFEIMSQKPINKQITTPPKQKQKIKWKYWGHSYVPFESIFTKKPHVATGCKLQVKRGGWKLQGNWGCTCAGCYRPEEHPCTRMSGQGLGQVLGPSSSIMDILVSRKNNREWATIMSPGSITAIHDLNVYLVNPLSHRSNCLPEMETITWRD